MLYYWPSSSDGKWTNWPCKIQINLTANKRETQLDWVSRCFFGVESKRVVNKIWREHRTKGEEDDDCISIQRNRWADVSGHDRRTNEMAMEKQSKVLRNEEGGWMINKWNNPNLPIKKNNNKKKVNEQQQQQQLVGIDTRPLMLYISFSWHVVGVEKRNNKSFVVISDHPIGTRHLQAHRRN